MRLDSYTTVLRIVLLSETIGDLSEKISEKYFQDNLYINANDILLMNGLTIYIVHVDIVVRYLFFILVKKKRDASIVCRQRSGVVVVSIAQYEYHVSRVVLEIPMLKD